MSVVAAPALIAAGAVIILLSRKSPFVAHQRVGTAGVPFWMWKLRTMWDDSHEGTGTWKLVERIANGEIPEDKSSPDPRIRNRFSSFCRRHSIDELPQLFHVALGQMSLVGPRPITRKELDRHYGAKADEVLQLRPGITGLWQVNGRNILTYQERCQMDLALVRGFSLPLYASILLRTIPKLISGAGSR
jgi:exopolysaccharide production protein ExoY